MDLGSILSQHFKVSVTLAASSTAGKLLSEDKLESVLKACDVVESLEYKKRRVNSIFLPHNRSKYKLMNASS